MSPRRGLTLAAYARAVEQLLAAAAHGPVVLSPRDWQRVDGWYQGIPLVVIHEALDAGAGRAGGGGGGPTLSSVAPAIEEAWSVVVEGRLGPAPAGSAEPSCAAARCWAARGAACVPGTPLAELLGRLLASLAAGEPAGRLDDELDRHLVVVADADDLAAIGEQLERELSPFRWRIAADRLEATRQRAVVERLRRRLGLPRLSG